METTDKQVFVAGKPARLTIDDLVRSCFCGKSDAVRYARLHDLINVCKHDVTIFATFVTAIDDLSVGLADSEDAVSQLNEWWVTANNYAENHFSVSDFAKYLELMN